MGIWDNLNTLKVGAGSNPEDINRQTKDVHLQESNRSELQDIITINNATFRGDAGIIPDTQVLDQSGEESSDAYYEVFTASRGEVWAIQVLNWETKNASAISWYVNDGTNRCRISYMSTTGPDLGDEMPPNLYITYPMKLEVYLSGASGSNVWTTLRARVR